jgi:hypothetical protein
VQSLLDLLDWAAEGHPIIWVPHTDAPEEAQLVQMPDQIDISDHYEYANATDHRLHGLKMDLTPWLT